MKVTTKPKSLISFVVKTSRVNIQLLRFSAVCAVLLLTNTNLAIGQSEAVSDLPRILSLPDALGMLDAAHPNMRYLDAESARLDADQVTLESRLALRANLGLEVRQVDRLSSSGVDFEDDSRALIVIDKPLLDFGKSDAGWQGMQAARDAADAMREYQLSKLKVDLIQAYFDVLIADYAYAVDDEKMTLTYLTYDDVRDQMERFNEVAEVDVREHESLYFTALAKRNGAAQHQRYTRLKLALALNRPTAYPDQLLEPDLSVYPSESPDYETVVQQALESHSGVRALQGMIEAKEIQVAGLSLKNRPVLGVRLQAAEYAKERSGNRDQYRASIYLDIPLSGGRSDLESHADKNADLLELQARQAVLEQTVRLEVLEHIQEINLQRENISAAKTHLLYRELALDKVRLQYEMEIRARIGNANMHVAEALHRLAMHQYAHALAWEKLDALVGGSLIKR